MDDLEQLKRSLRSCIPEDEADILDLESGHPYTCKCESCLLREKDEPC